MKTIYAISVTLEVVIFITGYKLMLDDRNARLPRPIETLNLPSFHFSLFSGLQAGDPPGRLDIEAPNIPLQFLLMFLVTQ